LVFEQYCGQKCPDVRRFHNFLVGGQNVFLPNILSVTVAHLGKWNILLIGEEHIPINIETQQNLSRFLKGIVTSIQQKNKCVDFFLEARLPPKSAIMKHSIQGGMSIALFHVIDNAETFGNPEFYRLHLWDTRNDLPSEFNRHDNTYNDEDILYSILNEHSLTVDIHDQDNNTLSIGRFVHTLNKRLKKEFDKIDLDATIKEHLKPEIISKDINPGTRGLLYTDLYLFYRLLMTYNKVSHNNCPMYNQYSIVYGGQMHITNILTMLNCVAEKTELLFKVTSYFLYDHTNQFQYNAKIIDNIVQDLINQNMDISPTTSPQQTSVGVGTILYHVINKPKVKQDIDECFNIYPFYFHTNDKDAITYYNDVTSKDWWNESPPYPAQMCIFQVTQDIEGTKNGTMYTFQPDWKQKLKYYGEYIVR
jgi:hypothetical protein